MSDTKMNEIAIALEAAKVTESAKITEAAKVTEAPNEIVYGMPDRYTIKPEELKNLSRKEGMLFASKSFLLKSTFYMTLSGKLESSPYYFEFLKKEGEDTLVIFDGAPIGQIQIGVKKKRDVKLNKFFLMDNAPIYTQNMALSYGGSETPLGPWKMMASVSTYFINLLMTGRWATNDGITIPTKGGDEPRLFGVKWRDMKNKRNG